MPSLMLLFLIPLASAIAMFALPLKSGKVLKRLAVLFSVLPLAMLLYGHTAWLGSQVRVPWFPAASIEFYLSVDQLTLLFLYLTALIVPISLLAVRSEALAHPHTFYGLVLLLEGLLIGFFAARDLAIFVLFYEAMLLPLYFLITLWGGHDRKTAAIKFLIYMIAGSALMIVGALGLYFAEAAMGTGTFDLDALAKNAAASPYAPWICAIFLLAFAVKTPLFPFHAWLPDAYCQASTAGTILIAGILSKAGIYGILRISLNFFPDLMMSWSPLLLSLAILGTFYGGFAAWMQKDYKRLIAYSSLSHVNFVLAGLFVWTQPAQAGAILQALNHGVTIAALFLAAGWLEERLGTTRMGHVNGLAKFMPALCWFTLIFVLSSVALPGTNNFVGELMILFGLFGHNPWAASILALTMILTVIYMLRWMQITYFEAPSFFQESWVDIKAREGAVALALAALIFWIGLYPTPVLKLIEPAANQIAAVSAMEEPA